MTVGVIAAVDPPTRLGQHEGGGGGDDDHQCHRRRPFIASFEQCAPSLSGCSEQARQVVSIVLAQKCNPDV